MAKRAVAVFIPHLHARGGTERATLEMIRRWSKSREVTVYCNSFGAENIDNVRVVVRRHRTGVPTMLQWASFVVWATVKATMLRLGRNPPIVFTPGVNLLWADVTVADICFNQHNATLKRLRREHVIDFGLGYPAGPTFRDLHAPLFAACLRVAERRFYRRSKLVYAVSPRLAEGLVALGVQPTGIAPNGVDTEAFPRVQPRETAPMRVLAVGNEYLTKGFDGLSLAVSLMPDDRTTLTVATRVQHAKFLGSFFPPDSDRLTIVTESVETADLFATHDIYAAPSAEDSFNMPALEAMASGLPVVMSQNCGLAFWAKPAGAAIIHEPGPWGVRAALEELVDHPELRSRVADAGRKLAESMTWDVPADEIEAGFQRLDAAATTGSAST